MRAPLCCTEGAKPAVMVGKKASDTSSTCALDADISLWRAILLLSVCARNAWRQGAPPAFFLASNSDSISAALLYVSDRNPDSRGTCG